MTAHFHVIQHASARTSSRLTFQWYRMPPLPVVELHAVAREHLQRAVVHLHGKVDGQLSLRGLEQLDQAGVQSELLADAVDLFFRDLERVEFLARFRHDFVPFAHVTRQR
jgi:hypothetical protein